MFLSRYLFRCRLKHSVSFSKRIPFLYPHNFPIPANNKIAVPGRADEPGCFFFILEYIPPAVDVHEFAYFIAMLADIFGIASGV